MEMKTEAVERKLENELSYYPDDFKPTDEYICPAHPMVGRVAKTADDYIKHVKKCQAIRQNKVYCCRYRFHHIFLTPKERDKHNEKCFLRHENPTSKSPDDVMILPKNRGSEKNLKEKKARQKQWWRVNGWLRVEEKEFMMKHRSTMASVRTDDDPDKLIKRFKSNTCEPHWEGKLRENTKKFESKLVNLEFPFLSEKPTFTVGNNIDFCRWALTDTRIILTDSATIYALDFKRLRDNLFEYRKNLIVSGIFVNESVHHRPQFHEQIESVFEQDSVFICRKHYPDLLLVFSYTTRYLQGYLERGSIGVMYYNAVRGPGELFDTQLLKEKKVQLKTVRGQLNQVVMEDEFCSDDDKETRDMEKKYQAMIVEQANLENYLKDLNEIHDLRKGTFEKLFTEIMMIRQDPDLRVLRGKYEEKKKEADAKENQVKEEFKRLENFRKKCEEEKEETKRKLFKEYSALNHQIDAEWDAKKEEWRKTRETKRLRKREVEKLRRDKENMENELRELEEMVIIDKGNYQRLKKDYKGLKGVMINKQERLNGMRPDKMKDCEEFYCPTCGERLGTVALVGCGHFFCDKCFLATVELKKCLICKKNASQIVYINHSSFFM